MEADRISKKLQNMSNKLASLIEDLQIIKEDLDIIEAAVELEITDEDDDSGSGNLAERQHDVDLMKD